MSKFVEQLDPTDTTVQDRPSLLREAIGEDVQDHTNDVEVQHKLAEQPSTATPHERLHAMAIVCAVMMAMFIFSFDQTIAAIALPSVCDAFNALDRMAWMMGTFFLTLVVFTMPFFQWCQFVPAKHNVMMAVLTFATGTLLSALAPNVAAFLAGRALSGMGGAGLYSGTVLVITENFCLHARATVFCLVGVSFSVAALLAPMLGGHLLKALTWRWCFLLNVPVAMVAMALLLFAVQARAPFGYEAMYTGYDWTMVDRLLHCDWCGMLLLAAWCACLMIMTAYGGHALPWKGAWSIVLLVSMAVLPLLLAIWEWQMGHRAMLRMMLLRRRNLASLLLTGCAVMCGFAIHLLFVSEMLRALYDVTGWRAGLCLLPMVIGQIGALCLTSAVIVRTGYVWFMLILSPLLILVASTVMAIMPASLSLMTTACLGFVSGFGVGIASQAVLMVAQLEVQHEPELLSSATGAAVFFNNVGRLLGATVAPAIFGNLLMDNLQRYAPALPSEQRVHVRHNTRVIWQQLVSPLREQVLQAYRMTIDDVFWAATAVAGMGIVASLMAKRQRLL